MNYSSDVLKWLLENYKRLSTKSPRLFRVWQIIGMTCALVTGVPLFLQQLDMFLGFHIPLPDIVNHWVVRVVFWCGLIVKLMAKLPTSDTPTMVSDEKKKAVYPFTNQINK
jgi:hypothetical protein